VLSHFPELEGDVVDRRSRAMKVRHVLAMASGHTRDLGEEAFAKDREEPVRGFLMIPPDEEPGSVFTYNQLCTYSLAAIVQRRAGMRLTEYLRPRLFEPLGIGEVGWQAWPGDREVGFTGLHGRTEDVAKLGLLYLQRGRWGDRQLVPEAYVDADTTKQVDNPREPNVDWRQGYGYQFWMHRHGDRGDGAFGQFCVVLPEHDAVIATTAATEQLQKVLDAMWRHLLPAFGPRPLTGRTDEEKALQHRLDRLALPPVDARPEPAEDPGRWPGARFTPRGGRCTDQPTLTAVEVGEADGVWTVTLVEGEDGLALRLSGAGWATADGPVPTAVSGGWTDADTLRVDVLFLETPHRLTVTCTLGDGTCTARWHTTPLHGGPLQRQRAPFPYR
jgi:hypothetical protein